jgi:hypothetical protein
MVGHLRVAAKAARKVTIAWSNPHATDLAGVVVRRGRPGACPLSRRQGVRIGGTSVRTSQADVHVAASTRYCYSVFAFDRHGNVSRAATTRVSTPAAPTPLLPVTHLTAATVHGKLQLSWTNPTGSGITSVVVRRGLGSSCPTGPTDGTAVGGTAVRGSQADAGAKPGIAYCYRVYALNAAGNASPTSAHTKAATPPPPTLAAGAPTPSSSWLTSTLMRAVALIGLLMLLVTAAATVVTRRRTQTSAYVTAREDGPRLALTGVAPGALVIPGLLVLAGCGVIAFVLLNL